LTGGRVSGLVPSEGASNKLVGKRVARRAIQALKRAIDSPMLKFVVCGLRLINSRLVYPLEFSPVESVERERLGVTLVVYSVLNAEHVTAIAIFCASHVSSVVRTFEYPTQKPLRCAVNGLAVVVVLIGMCELFHCSPLLVVYFACTGRELPAPYV